MIVGVDVSSRRIDLAWLENGKPQRWHQELAKGHLIDRLRSIRIQWPEGHVTNRRVWGAASLTEHTWETTEIAIEYPFGRGNAIAALMATVGVITRQAPPWARVAWPSAGELRQAIGAKNNKQAAHREIRFWSSGAVTGESFTDGWDEHELDALVACIGWQKILESQETA